MLILHYTGMVTAGQAIERLCDPVSAVSAHYLIDEDGAVSRLVPEDRRAWHAGHAAWGGARDVNGCSIGIELVNPGHVFGYRPFPASQMESLEALCHIVLSRHPIPTTHVLGHSDVAPDRKEDPGELFDWGRLACAGIGVWPVWQLEPAGYVTAGLSTLQRGLAELGYAVEPSGVMDASTRAVILAFQRHWLPWNLTGARDRATSWRLQSILEEFRAVR